MLEICPGGPTGAAAMRPRHPVWPSAAAPPKVITWSQVGNRPVWEEALQAYAQWASWGQPHWRRYDITVTPGLQSIWLDTPERVLNST
ncbi:hypothetical protein SAMN05444920_14913 [Nonomuraea solani]|uniref:Uncharacterized protein n=1 Tax=Nonomuraea solani TaxID=1144553 RepID=A0A1H6F2V4_9ACTN|nr:hypothetical protein SAMN05444920_14913 [Nonomuraea solani]